MRNRIRIHFERKNSTFFIHKIIDVSKAQINKMRSLYLEIDVLEVRIMSRTSKLVDYHVKELLQFLREKLTVY